MEVVEKIFSLVDQKFKNDKVFASEIGVSPARVSEWRTGKSKSYMKRLDVIASVLGVTIGELHGEPASKTTVARDVGAKELPADKTIVLIEKDAEGHLLATPVVQKLSDRDARLLAWFRSLSPEKQKAILISQDAPKDIL